MATLKKQPSKRRKVAKKNSSGDRMHYYLRPGWYEHLFSHLRKPTNTPEFKARFEALVADDSAARAKIKVWS